MTSKDNLIRLHLSDWNMSNKYYLVPREIMQQFYEKLKGGMEMGDAWTWFTDQGIDYSDGHVVDSKPIKCVDFEMDVFLDWENPSECVLDWEEDQYVVPQETQG